MICCELVIERNSSLQLDDSRSGIQCGIRNDVERVLKLLNKTKKLYNDVLKETYQDIRVMSKSTVRTVRSKFWKNNHLHIQEVQMTKRGGSIRALPI